jgi:hypothetical protein
MYNCRSDEIWKSLPNAVQTDKRDNRRFREKNICIPDTGIKFTILAATQQQRITIRKTEGRGTR